MLNHEIAYNIPIFIEQRAISKILSMEFIENDPMEPMLILESPVVSEPVFTTIPKLIFIVPYRDREQQLNFFLNHMKTVLSDMNPSDYKIYISEQKDNRDFNRGALKNIGFLAMKQKYPHNYQNITFVFNDIDTMPYTKNFLNYQTSAGVVKHFYGYTFALGGIVSITGGDFERISGFPNFWAWGFEDNMLQNRVVNAGLKIDRSQFYNIMDKNIIQLKDGLTRLVNRNEFDRYISNTNEGVQSIYNIQFDIDDIDETSGMIRIKYFLTGTNSNSDKNTEYDLRRGGTPFSVPVKNGRRNPKMGMIM